MNKVITSQLSDHLFEKKSDAIMIYGDNLNLFSKWGDNRLN